MAEERKINKEWHEKNRMPEKPNPTVRLNWHKRHQKVCACRSMPKGLLDLESRRKQGVA